MPIGSRNLSFGDHSIRAGREFIHDLAGYMTIGNRDISFWLEFWMRAKEGNLLSRQHQKICCRDFKAISRESSCPFMTGGNLIEGNSQFPRKKFPRWADRLIPFLGFKQRHGAIIFYQYEIHLPLFLIPDIHQLKKAQARLRKPGAHPKESYRQHILKALSGIFQKRPVKKEQFFLFFNRTQDIAMPGRMILLKYRGFRWYSLLTMGSSQSK